MAAAKIDAERKRIETATAQADLDLKLAQIGNLPSYWKTAITNPIVLGAIITAFVALNSSIVTYVTSVGLRDIEREKLRTQRELEQHKLATQLGLEQKKFETDLVLRAMSVNDPDKAAGNLLFFIRAGMLSDQKGEMRLILQSRNPGEGVVLPGASR